MTEQAILITGAGRGFGLELTREYHAMGWRVFPVVRSEESAEKLSGTVSPDLEMIIADVTDDSVGDLLHNELSARTDSLQLLINNAGVMARGPTIADVDLEQVRLLTDVHCFGALRCIKGCWPLLLRADGATIVNVTSRLGSISNVAAGAFDHLNSAYAMRISKAAQNMLTASVYRDARRHGMSVYAVHPGQLQTRMGLADADLTAAAAAKRFVSWLADIKGEQDCGYFEPNAREFDW